jgi:Dyp-type peroxidase family
MRTRQAVDPHQYTLPGQTPHAEGSTEALLDLNDIQSFILYPVAFPHSRYCFFHFPDATCGRRFVKDIAAMTTDATLPPGAPLNGRKPWEVSAAFTFNGLSALGIPPRSLRSFPLEFQQGMKARARDLLVDRGDSDPENWEPLWRDGRVHMLVILQSLEEKSQSQGVLSVEALLGMVETSASRYGVELLYVQHAAALVTEGSAGMPTDKEHFGYSDGIGNPDIEGEGWPAHPGSGKSDGKGGWIPLKPGEFVLGYVNESGELPHAPVPMMLGRNGSFLAYRKLHEHVGRFRSWLREEGAKYHGGPELLAAKLVGRFRDGTPLEISPDSAYPVTAKDRLDPSFAAKLTDFNYSQDKEGSRCPMGSHIRRMNPRDSLGFDGVLVNQRRIIRRGLPYGSWVPEKTPDAVMDELDRFDDENESRHGVIFMALQASLERQFEFVQREWLNYGNDFRQGNDRDPILGNRENGSRAVIQGDASADRLRPMHVCKGLPQFVTTRGGEYFFIPGIAALRAIAAGDIESS